MKLTKAQRRICYRYALKEINGEQFYLCYLLRQAVIREFGRALSPKNIPSIFPEFKRKRPKDYNQYIGWWSMSDIEIRKKVLRACIRETAPKKRKKVSNQTKSKQ